MRYIEVLHSEDIMWTSYTCVLIFNLKLPNPTLLILALRCYNFFHILQFGPKQISVHL